MFLLLFDRSEVPTHKERVRLLLKLCLRVEFFLFLRLGLYSEWSWHFVAVRAQREDIFLLVLHRKLLRAPDGSKNSKYGAAGAPDRDIVQSSSKMFLHNNISYIVHEP
jgi:hypothetical protein